MKVYVSDWGYYKEKHLGFLVGLDIPLDVLMKFVYIDKNPGKGRYNINYEEVKEFLSEQKCRLELSNLSHLRKPEMRVDLEKFIEEHNKRFPIDNDKT